MRRTPWWLVAAISLLCGIAFACGPETAHEGTAADAGPGGAPSSEPGSLSCSIVNERLVCRFLSARK